MKKLLFFISFSLYNFLSLYSQQLVEYPVFSEKIGFVENEVANLDFPMENLKTFTEKWTLKLIKDDNAALELSNFEIKFFENKGWSLFATGNLGEQSIAYRTFLRRSNNDLFLLETKTMEICICATNCNNGGFAEQYGCFCDTGDCQHEMMMSMQ